MYAFFKMDPTQRDGYFTNWAEKYETMKADNKRIFLFEEFNVCAKFKYNEQLIDALLKV